MDNTSKYQTWFYGLILLVIIISFQGWAISKPQTILDKQLVGNHDLLYFATDAPDNFLIYSPGLHDYIVTRSASERMADMVVSPDGQVVWTATKSGFVDRYEFPLAYGLINTGSIIHKRIAPVLASVALSANGRFIAVAYGYTEDYNARNVKILPADTVDPIEELDDFAVSGDIQDIVANPVRDLFYIVNSHSDRIRIYNTDRFRLERDIIEMGNSPGRFVVRPDGARAYGAMNARKTVTVVNLETNEVIDNMLMGFPPYAMCFNEDGSHLYVASRDSDAVTIINTETNKIIVSFILAPRIEGLLEFNYAEIIAVSSDEQYFYVMPKRRELLVYDISIVHDESYVDEKPSMVQSKILATEPMYMEIIRHRQVPGVPEE